MSVGVNPGISPTTAQLALILLSSLSRMVAISAVQWWGLFAKCGISGWGSMVPFVNWFLLLRVAGLSPWWFVAMLVPVANLFAWWAVSLAIADRFGRSTSFGLGLWLLPIIFFPILSWGRSTPSDLARSRAWADDGFSVWADD